MTAEALPLDPVPAGRRPAPDRSHLRLVPPLPDRPGAGAPDVPLSLVPVAPPGTPWRQAVRLYAREPAWQLALAHAWLVPLAPLLLAAPSAVARGLLTVLLPATALVVLVALVRDLADLRAWGAVAGWRGTCRMLRHAVTLGPWGYLGVRGKRTGEWGPFLAATITWAVALVSTGTALLCGW